MYKTMAQSSVYSNPNISVRKGYFFAALGSILYAMKGVLIKLAYGDDATHIEVDAITLLTLRMAFSLPFYSVIGIMALNTRRREGLPLPRFRVFLASMGLGLMGYYASAYLDFEGLVYLSAQFERLLLFTYPMFVMLLGVLFFGAVVTAWRLATLLVTYSGIAIIFVSGATARGEHALWGAGLVLVAAFSFAIYQLVAKSLIHAVGSRIFTCVAMSAAATATLVHFLATHQMQQLFDLPPRIFWLAALIALFATVLPSFMLNAALGRITAQAVSVLGSISPVVTVILAVVLINEPFTLTDALGTVLVVGGVGLFTLYDSRKARLAVK
jgi:drug/metabolite transporter (DMT)-like permease